MVVKMSEMENLRKGKGKKKKVVKIGDILEWLWRIVFDDLEDEDDFVDICFVLFFEWFIKISFSSNFLEEEFVKVLKLIFKCFICLNIVYLFVVVCVFCYVVMGCIFCVE